MLGVNKVAALGIWALTLAAAFAVGRSTAPVGSDAPVETDAAVDNLASAIEAALSEPDVLERSVRTALLLQQLDAENVAEVAAVYDRLLNILGEVDILPFVGAWARFDPKGALVHVLRWPFQDKTELGVTAAVETWAMRDPAAALDAGQKIGKRQPKLENALFLALLTGWVNSGQAGVDDYIAELPDGMLDTAVNRVAAKTLRGGGVDAMVRWVDSITGNDSYSDQFKKKAFRRGIRMVARWDPQRAAAWAMENRDRDYAADAPRIIAEEWGTIDGRAALAWVREYPDEEVRYPAARGAYFSWLKADRSGAVAWLESETLTDFHEPAIILYAKDLGSRAPAEAVDWCERVLDEERRLRCLEKAAAQWYQRDAVAAETWLQKSPLDEAARRTARTPPDQQRQRLRASAQQRAGGDSVE